MENLTAFQKGWFKELVNPLNLEDILLGDNLYAHEPFCRDTLKQGYSFIFVAKRDSHKVMYDHIDFLQGINEIDTHETIQGKPNEKEIWKYRFVEDVPLNGNKDALKVNWMNLKYLIKKQENRPTKTHL